MATLGFDAVTTVRRAHDVAERVGTGEPGLGAIADPAVDDVGRPVRRWIGDRERRGGETGGAAGVVREHVDVDRLQRGDARGVVGGGRRGRPPHDGFSALRNRSAICPVPPPLFPATIRSSCGTICTDWP